MIDKSIVEAYLKALFKHLGLFSRVLHDTRTLYVGPLVHWLISLLVPYQLFWLFELFELTATDQIP